MVRPLLTLKPFLWLEHTGLRREQKGEGDSLYCCAIDERASLACIDSLNEHERSHLTVKKYSWRVTSRVVTNRAQITAALALRSLFPSSLKLPPPSGDYEQVFSFSVKLAVRADPLPRIRVCVFITVFFFATTCASVESVVSVSV